jgi:hypothetical protein
MAETDLQRLEARVAELERRQQDLPAPGRSKAAKAGGQDWDAYAAVIATFIGILALAVAGYTSYLQRRQLQAQVWPRIMMGASDVDMKLIVENQGTGPARVTAFRVTVDDRPMKGWAEVRKAFGFGENSKMMTYSSVNGRVLPAGQLLVFAAANKDETSRQKFDDMLEGRGHQLGITLCYCSVLDDCWVVRFGRQPASELKLDADQCPVRAADRFYN